MGNMFGICFLLILVSVLPSSCVDFSCKGKPNGKYAYDGDPCTHGYWQCFAHVLYPAGCSTLYYDSRDKDCKPKDEVPACNPPTTTMPTATTTTTTTTTTSIRTFHPSPFTTTTHVTPTTTVFTCNGKPDGHYPMNGDPCSHSYWICFANTMYAATCSDKFFDSRDKHCKTKCDVTSCAPLCHTSASHSSTATTTLAQTTTTAAKSSWPATTTTTQTFPPTSTTVTQTSSPKSTTTVTQTSPPTSTTTVTQTSPITSTTTVTQTSPITSTTVPQNSPYTSTTTVAQHSPVSQNSPYTTTTTTTTVTQNSPPRTTEAVTQNRPATTTTASGFTQNWRSNVQTATCIITHDPHVTPFGNYKLYHPQPRCDCDSYALKLVGFPDISLDVWYRTEPSCKGSDGIRCDINPCPGTQIKEIWIHVIFKNNGQPLSHATVHVFKDPHMNCGITDVHFEIKDCNNWCPHSYPLQRDTNYQWNWSNWGLAVYEMSLPPSKSTFVTVTLTHDGGDPVFEATYQGFDRGCQPISELNLKLHSTWYKPISPFIRGICNTPFGGYMQAMHPDNETCWDVIQPCSSCKLKSKEGGFASSDKPSSYSYVSEDLAENVCGVLTADPGPFSKCFNSSVIRKYANDTKTFCKMDLGLIRPTNVSDFVCSYGTSLAQKCKDENKIAVPWRNETFCRLNCSSNAHSHFNTSAIGCPATCDNPYAPEQCTIPAESACECDDGYILDYSGECVKPENCGCFDPSAQYHIINSSWVNHDCSLYCNCSMMGGSPVIRCKKFRSPCKTNSVCNVTNNGEDHVCFCMEGYKEQNGNCVRINRCHNMTCGNGTCLNMFPEPMCICPLGFVGTHCEKPLNFCDAPFVCEHNATCIPSFDNYTCICQEGFTGRHCEHQLTHTSSIPTAHTPKTTTVSLCGLCIHGTCINQGPLKYICRCKPGYTGSHCDTPW